MSRHGHDGHGVRRPLRRLLLALWVGGLATVDLVETPARFRTTELDRNQIVAIGRRVFAAVNRMEMGLGLALLPLTLRGDRRRLQAAVLAMWSTALAQGLLLQPRMRKVAADLDFVRQDPGNPRYGQHRQLHTAYVGLDVLKLVVGAGAILGDDD